MFSGDCPHSLCQFFFVLVGQRNQFGHILFEPLVHFHETKYAEVHIWRNSVNYQTVIWSTLLTKFKKR